jgi:hypothetical protein
MSEFIDQAKDNYEKIQELNLLKKAIPNAQKLKQFAYTDNENLTRQIMMIYPECTHVVIVNNDKRDGLGIPTINTKQLRAMYVTQTTSNYRRVISSQNYTTCQVMLCLIENNIVSVKVINRAWGDSTY